MKRSIALLLCLLMCLSLLSPCVFALGTTNSQAQQMINPLLQKTEESSQPKEELSESEPTKTEEETRTAEGEGYMAETAEAGGNTLNLTNYKFYVKANESANLANDVSVSLSDNTGIIYLPANADTTKLSLYWTTTDSTVATATVNNTSHSSGDVTIPTDGSSISVKFVAGSKNKTVTFKTMKGSEGVGSIFLSIDETKGTISLMNDDSTHETLCYGLLNLDGISYNMSIKGRGNSTWTYTTGGKRPYNITLLDDYTKTTEAEKVEGTLISGITTKKWSLIANYADGSLLRNKIGYDLANSLGIGLDSRFVDLWMNGEYLGNYLLTPKSDYQASKKGYIVELDNKTEPTDGDPQFNLDGLNSLSGFTNKFTVKDIGKKAKENLQTPETIQAWMQEALNAIKNYNSEAYLNYIDLDSFAKMYLVYEFAKSYDVISGSMLMHRDGLTSEDKLIAGPIWDLDNSMGRSQTCSSYTSTNKCQQSPDGWIIDSITNDSVSFLQLLGKHESFMKRVAEIYNENKSSFDSVTSNFTTQKNLIAKSAEMNFTRWNANQTQYNVTKYDTDTSCGTSPYNVTYKKTTGTTDPQSVWNIYVENLNKYVTKRLLFLSNKLSVTLPTGSVSGTTSYKEGETVTLTGNITNSGTFTYQWQSSTDGTTWTDLAGKTTKTFSATASDDMDGLNYQLLVTSKGSTKIGTTRVSNITPSCSAALGPVCLSVSAPFTVTPTAALSKAFTVSGQTVTVSYSLPCKLGYWDEAKGKYIALTAVSNAENGYDFTVPKNVSDVVLVVKGDSNGSGSLELRDATIIKGFINYMMTPTALQNFSCDIDNSSSLTLRDAQYIKGFINGLYTISWN